MKLLLDTHLLLWAAGDPGRLSLRARSLIDDPGNLLLFSAASFWEISIKLGLGRSDFHVDPGALRRGLIHSGYIEIPVTTDHASVTATLPPLHKDPFGRLLVAQAMAENAILVTADSIVAQYPAHIEHV